MIERIEGKCLGAYKNKFHDGTNGLLGMAGGLGSQKDNMVMPIKIMANVMLTLELLVLSISLYFDRCNFYQRQFINYI